MHSLLSVIRSTMYVCIAGLVVGGAHRSPVLLAALLVAVLLAVLWLARRSWSSHFGLLLGGVFATFLLGWVAEVWGTSNGFWAYHAEGYDARVPPWVPLAWGLAYLILYRCEQRLVENGGWFDSLGKKLLLAALVSLTLPVLGEIIAINLGVWTYTWPCQFLGVPILAIGLLLVLHATVFVVLFVVARQRRLSDPLFGATQ